MATNIASKVLEYLIMKHEEQVAFLKRLVSFESPSHDAESQKDMLQLLAKTFEKPDFFLLYLPSKQAGGYLYAQPKNRQRNKPLQLLVGHCDTVWKKDTLEEMRIVALDGKLALHGLMKSFDLVPDFVTGIASNTLAGIEMVNKLCGLKVLDLIDASTTDGLKRILTIKTGLSLYNL